MIRCGLGLGARWKVSLVLLGLCLRFLVLIFAVVISRNVDDIIADLAEVSRTRRTYAFPNSLCKISKCSEAQRGIWEQWRQMCIPL